MEHFAHDSRRLNGPDASTRNSTLVGGLVDGAERQLSGVTAGLLVTILVGKPEVPTNT